MNRTRVKFYPEAIRDYISIMDYLRQESGEGLARRWLRAIHDTTNALQVLPLQGIKCSFPPPIPSDLRRVLLRGFSNYLVFYQYDESEHLVSIFHIFHGSRDLPAALSEGLQ